MFPACFLLGPTSKVPHGKKAAVRPDLPYTDDLNCSKWPVYPLRLLCNVVDITVEPADNKFGITENIFPISGDKPFI